MVRRLAFAALIVTALSAPRPAAADGFYFFEGLGGSRYRGDLARTLGDTGLNIRGGIGWRLGHIAIEGYAKAELGPLTAHAGDVTVAERSSVPCGCTGSLGGLAIVGLDLKVLQPLSAHWSAYARGGISKMMADNDYEGRGVGAAAGIQVAGKVPALGFLWAPLFFLDKGPKVHASLWLEASTSFHRLHGEGPSIDARIDGWTFGFAVGQDF